MEFAPGIGAHMCCICICVYWNTSVVLNLIRSRNLLNWFICIYLDWFLYSRFTSHGKFLMLGFEQSWRYIFRLAKFRPGPAQLFHLKMLQSRRTKLRRRNPFEIATSNRLYSHPFPIGVGVYEIKLALHSCPPTTTNFQFYGGWATLPRREPIFHIRCNLRLRPDKDKGVWTVGGGFWGGGRTGRWLCEKILHSTGKFILDCLILYNTNLDATNFGTSTRSTISHNIKTIDWNIT